MKAFRLHSEKLNNPLRTQLFVRCDVFSDGLEALVISLSRIHGFFFKDSAVAAPRSIALPRSRCSLG